MNISTPVLTLRGGGVISTSSLGKGDAGSITINAGRVEVIGNGVKVNLTVKFRLPLGLPLALEIPMLRLTEVP
jgi:large exoprotein involved in heme utilization and adhesion